MLKMTIKQFLQSGGSIDPRGLYRSPISGIRATEQLAVAVYLSQPWFLGLEGEELIGFLRKNPELINPAGPFYLGEVPTIPIVVTVREISKEAAWGGVMFGPEFCRINFSVGELPERFGVAVYEKDIHLVSKNELPILITPMEFLAHEQGGWILPTAKFIALDELGKFMIPE